VREVVAENFNAVVKKPTYKPSRLLPVRSSSSSTTSGNML